MKVHVTLATILALLFSQAAYADKFERAGVCIGFSLEAGPKHQIDYIREYSEVTLNVVRKYGEHALQIVKKTNACVGKNATEEVYEKCVSMLSKNDEKLVRGYADGMRGAQRYDGASASEVVKQANALCVLVGN